MSVCRAVEMNMPASRFRTYSFHNYEGIFCALPQLRATENAMNAIIMRQCVVCRSCTSKTYVMCHDDVIFFVYIILGDLGDYVGSFHSVHNSQP